MTPLQLTLDIERAPWTDVDPVAIGRVARIGLLRNGTKEGKASVAIVIETDDGQQIIGETTWALLRTAFGALAACPLVAEEVIDP